MKHEEYYIEDVVATGRRQNKIEKVKVGDNVKIVLRLNKPVNNIDAERLWFRVLKINEDALLVELDNDPVHIKTLSGVDRLSIKLSNVLEVLAA